VGELRTNVDKYSLAGFSQYKEDIDSNLSSIKEKINLIGSKEMVGFLEGLTSLESNTLEIEKAFVSYDSSDKNEFFVEVFSRIKALDKTATVMISQLGDSIEKIYAEQKGVSKLLIIELKLGTLLVVMVGIFLAIVFSRIISRPIKKLNSFALEFSSGNLSLRSDVVSRDEIGELSKSLNTMVDSLQKSQDELKKYNIKLEERVEERTKELGDKNLTLERINRLMVDRELAMVKLKERIKELESSVRDVVK
jgi:methyl-accepting chemotaxis protein